MGIYGWELPEVWHQLEKSCNHKHCDSGDIMLLICHMTSRKHRSCECKCGSPLQWITTLPYLEKLVSWKWPKMSTFMGGSCLKYVIILSSFGVHRHCGIGDIINLISQDLMIKRSCNFISRSPSRWDIILPSLMAMALWQWRHDGFCLSRDLARPLDQRAKWLYG